MSREPGIDEARYQSLLSFIESQGYDLNKVQRVPQVWPQNNATETTLDEAQSK
jgi:hypothetical protein